MYVLCIFSFEVTVNDSKDAFNDFELLGPINWPKLGWHWTDGDEIPFTDWGAAQPGLEVLDNCSCTYLRHSKKFDTMDQVGNWYITECAAKSTYVCQVPVTSKNTIFF